VDEDVLNPGWTPGSRGGEYEKEGPAEQEAARHAGERGRRAREMQRARRLVLVGAHEVAPELLERAKTLLSHRGDLALDCLRMAKRRGLVHAGALAFIEATSRWTA